MHMFTIDASRVTHTLRGALVAATVLLTGCGTTEAADPLQPTGPTGRIRFVNLSFAADTTASKVNAILEGKPFGVDLAYGRSTPSFLPAPGTAIYAPVYTGARTLVLKRTADTTVTVLTIPLQIENGADYTVYAVNSNPPFPIITRDTNTVPAAGQVRVRVVHLAPSAPNVDVFVTAVGADLATATPTLSNVALRTWAYLSVAAGTYQIRVVPAGTAPSARAASVAINSGSITLPAGGARTIIAADNITGGAPLRFVTLVDR